MIEKFSSHGPLGTHLLEPVYPSADFPVGSDGADNSIQRVMALEPFTGKSNGVDAVNYDRREKKTMLVEDGMHGCFQSFPGGRFLRPWGTEHEQEEKRCRVENFFHGLYLPVAFSPFPQVLQRKSS
jgi:hypothetical protein